MSIVSELKNQALNKAINPLIRLGGGYLNVILRLRIQAGKQVSASLVLRDFTAVLTLSITGLALAFLQLAGALKIFTQTLLLNLIIDLSLIASPLIYILYLYIKAIERGRGVEDELKYFIIAESVVASGNPSLFDDLISLRDKPYLFPILSNEAKVIAKVRKLLTMPDAVRVYCKWLKSNKVSVILSDYLFAQSLGMLRAWLREKGREFLDAIRSDSINRIKLRTTISVLFAVILGYIPPVILALSSLMGYGIIVKLLTLTLIIAPLFFIVTPKLPKHFMINSNGGRVARLAGVALLTCFVLTCINGRLGIEIHEPALALIKYLVGPALIMAGAPALIEAFKAFKEAGDLTKLILTIAEAPLEISNNLTVVREALRRLNSPKLRRLSKLIGIEEITRDVYRSMSLWITRFTVFTISKAISYGVLNKENLMKLRDLILEMIREIKTSITASAVIIALAISLPVMLNYICVIEGGVTSLIKLYVFTSVIIYSIYSSYVVFGDPLNTLLTGVALTELILMGFS